MLCLCAKGHDFAIVNRTKNKQKPNSQKIGQCYKISAAPLGSVFMCHLK